MNLIRSDDHPRIGAGGYNLLESEDSMEMAIARKVTDTWSRQNDIVIGSEHANDNAGLVLVVDGSRLTPVPLQEKMWKMRLSGRWVFQASVTYLVMDVQRF